MNVTALRCEYLENPFGIDVAAPLLSWVCTSNMRGDEQTAYRIMVFVEEQILWDTGKIFDKNNQIPYIGPTLESNRRYYWKVCVWDKQDVQSPYSEPAFFHTGIFSNEWSANWICKAEVGTSLPVFAKDFTLNKTVARAMVFISAPGMFELLINGQQASGALFEPGESNYDKKVFYSTYDVTDMLRENENKLFVYLGKGFYYNPPVTNRFNRIPKTWGELMLLCQLEIQFSDGTKTTISTDESWLTADGPLTESCWLGGEDYDARIAKDIEDGSLWQNATVASKLPFQKLESRKHPALQKIEVFHPVTIIPLANGDYTVDFGVNFAGIFTFTGTAAPGQKIYFYPAENIYEDGSVDQASTLFGKNKIYDTYTFAGDTTETYTPKFVYHGMRYLQISGITPTPDMICGYSVRCSNQEIGKLETSNHDINTTHRIINRSICANMYHVLTDCPHREKLGWLEVPHLLYNTIADNYDIAAYIRKITTDLCEAQAVSGSVPSIVPPFTTGIKEHALRDGTDTTPNDPIWCGVIIMLPYYSYLRYGDITLLRNTYSAMKAYMSYLTSLSSNYLVENTALNRDLGDWVSLAETSVTFAVSCMYYQLASTMKQVADILGDTDAAFSYSQLAENIASAINNRFFDRNTYHYDTGSQTANALSLFLGIVPAPHREQVLESLIKSVISADYHITTGEYGMRPLLNVLSEAGHCDIVYKVLFNDTSPSYKHFLNLGKTSLPEMWSGEYSQNHCILGHGDGWLYEYLAGIRNEGIAFDRIVIEPYFPDDMEWLSASLETPKGTVAEHWQRNDDRITLTVTIPVGTTARILLPTALIHSGLENVKVIADSNISKTVLEVASGKYTLTFIVS